MQFLNEVKTIEDQEIQNAEISQYNSQFEEASRLYQKNGRSDLNLAKLMKLG